MFYRVIIYSGGMDSFTLLHTPLSLKIIPADTETHALSFNYGQRHSRELRCAEAECAALGIKHTIINLPIKTMLTGSALTDDIQMPEGKYDDETMRLTVVPGRNTLMLAMALAYTEGLILAAGQQNPQDNSRGAIYYGAHAGDHYIYPDCRPEYITAMAETIQLASAGRVWLRAPFKHIDKGEILKRGLAMGLDYGKTWTCYKGGKRPCGVCGSCDERLAAFVANDTADPLLYESYGRWPVPGNAWAAGYPNYQGPAEITPPDAADPPPSD